MGDAVGDGVETRQLVLWDAQDGSTLNKVLLLEGCLLRVQSPWAAGLLGCWAEAAHHCVTGGCSVEVSSHTIRPPTAHPPQFEQLHLVHPLAPALDLCMW